MSETRTDQSAKTTDKEKHEVLKTQSQEFLKEFRNVFLELPESHDLYEQHELDGKPFSFSRDGFNYHVTNNTERKSLGLDISRVSDEDSLESTDVSIECSVESDRFSFSIGRNRINDLDESESVSLDADDESAVSKINEFLVQLKTPLPETPST